MSIFVDYNAQNVGDTSSHLCSSPNLFSFKLICSIEGKEHDEETGAAIFFRHDM